MSTTRREFLSRAALAAAMAGVGPGIASAMSAFAQSTRPYLDLATRCALWIDQSSQRHESGMAWPADPLKPTTIGLDLYNGMPGVVSFFANLYHAGGDARWRERAQQGGTYLVAESARRGAAVGGGLYTGPAPSGVVFAIAASSFAARRAWPDHCGPTPVTSRVL